MVTGESSADDRSMGFDTLAVRKEGGVLFADIAAPPMNLLGPGLVRDLVSLIQEAEADETVRVLVFTSGDPDYFTSHVDVTRIQEYREEAAKLVGEASIGLLFRYLSARSAASRPETRKWRLVCCCVIWPTVDKGKVCAIVPPSIAKEVKAGTLDKGALVMKSKHMRAIAIVTALASALSSSAMSAQDKYTLKVPGGLAFSEFRGYEAWQLVSISQDGPLMAAILGNPVMIKAYEAGFPGNGKPFPDGSKMAKIHWTPKKMEAFPAATVPGTQHDVDFMVKDSKRFKDSGGWGWGAFEYDPASKTFKPATTADTPPQGNDAKCGFACHTIVKARDYVFTDYGHR